MVDKRRMRIPVLLKPKFELFIEIIPTGASERPNYSISAPLSVGNFAGLAEVLHTRCF